MKHIRQARLWVDGDGGVYFSDGISEVFIQHKENFQKIATWIANPTSDYLTWAVMSDDGLWEENDE